MASTIARLFMIPTEATAASAGREEKSEKPMVSDFLTVQSLANFAAMTGAIGAAWQALARLSPAFTPLWVPYLLALLFGVWSVSISLEGLKKNGTVTFGTVFGASFVAFLNALILASAVVGAVAQVSNAAGAAAAAQHAGSAGATSAPASAQH